MCGVMLCRTNFSNISDWVGMNTGLQEVGSVSVGGSLGFRMGKIFASFHDVRTLFVIEKLSISVRALMDFVATLRKWIVFIW